MSVKTEKVKTHLLLMMAGSGTRFGGEIPKQFVFINIEPIFIYLLRQLEHIEEIDDILLITNPNYINETEKWVEEYKINKIFKVISGGNGRSKDILKGLEEYKDINPNDNILIFDATHPIVDKEGCIKVINSLDDYEAVTLAEFQYDTTYKMDKDTHIITEVINREEVIAGASPEAFKFKTIYEIFKNASDEELAKMTSAGAIALKHNLKMLAVQTNCVNLKITYKADYENFLRIAK